MRIQLTQGKFAIVDNEDYEYLMQWKWCAANAEHASYAIRSIKVGKKNVTIRMHREILGLKAGDGKNVDHINHNGLDNRRSNLRECTISQNCQNQVKQRVSRTSKYKGVWLNKQVVKGKTYRYWMAGVRKRPDFCHLGYFKTERDAALAYNKKAKELFGRFAHLNVIEPLETDAQVIGLFAEKGTKELTVK